MKFILVTSSPEGEPIRSEVIHVSANRQLLHTLVDMVEESGIDTLYNVMIKFIPEDEALPDEVQAIEQAREEYARGDTVRLADLKLG